MFMFQTSPLRTHLGRRTPPPPPGYRCPDRCPCRSNEALESCELRSQRSRNMFPSIDPRHSSLSTGSISLSIPSILSIFYSLLFFFFLSLSTLNSLSFFSLLCILYHSFLSLSLYLPVTAFLSIPSPYDILTKSIEWSTQQTR